MASFMTNDSLLSIYQDIPHLSLPKNHVSSETKELIELFEHFLSKAVDKDGSCKEGLRQLKSHQESILWLPEYGCCCLVTSGSSYTIKADVFLIAVDGWVHSFHHSYSHSSPEHSAQCAPPGSTPSSRFFSVLKVGELPSSDNETCSAFLKEVPQTIKTKHDELKSPEKSAGSVFGVITGLLSSEDSNEQLKNSTPIAGFTPVEDSKTNDWRDTRWKLIIAVTSVLAKWSDAFLQKVLFLFDMWALRKQLGYMERSSVGYDRSQMNVAMTMLKHCCLIVADLADRGEDLTSHAETIESLRSRLNRHVKCQRERLCSKNKLPLLIDGEYPQCRDFSCSPPSASLAPIGGREVGNPRQNLKARNVLSASQCSVEQLHRWVAEQRGNSQGSSSLDVEFQLATMDACVYEWSKLLLGGSAESLSSSGWSLETVSLLEQIYDGYMAIVSSSLSIKHSVLNLQVAVRSRAILLLWTIYCLVDKILVCRCPLVGAYGVSLDYRHLRHLVLERREAWEAVLRVADYLRMRSINKRCLFSTLDEGASYDFADQFTKNDADLNKSYQPEVEQANKRERTYWSEVERKREEARRLKKQIEDSQYRLSQIYMVTTHRDDGYYKSIRIAEKELGRLRSDLANAERPPNIVQQPLPKDRTLALRALFFIKMPPHLGTLCRLSFAASLALLPKNVISEIKCESPKTMLASYYTSSGGLVSTISNRLPLGTSLIPVTKCGPDHIDTLTPSNCGIWYPDTFYTTSSLHMYWNNEGRSPYACDPFRGSGKFGTENQYFMTIVQSFVEPKASYGWSLELSTADSILHARGNKSMTTQGDAIQDTLNRSEYLYLTSLRAYPMQQFRKLCSCLQNTLLPLDHRATLQFFTHTLYHIGDIEFSREAGKEKAKLSWKEEQLQEDWQNVFAAELSSLVDELRSSVRRHNAFLFAALISSFLAQWSINSSIQARHLSDAMEAIVEDQWQLHLKEEREGTKNPHLLPKVFRLLSYIIISFGGGSLIAEDAVKLCSAYVRLKHLMLNDKEDHCLEDKASLMAVAEKVVSTRLLEIVDLAKECPRILTEATRKILHDCPLDLQWTQLPGGWQSCFEAKDAHDQFYHIDLLSGVVLFNGFPPNRLPPVITSNKLYVRTFGDRNFNVKSSADGTFQAIQPVEGCYYSFRLIANTNCLVIVEKCEKTGQSLALLDSEEGKAKWLADFPETFKRVQNSHWYWREQDIIIVRQSNYLERRVSMYARRCVCEEDPSSSVPSWKCFAIPQHKCMAASKDIFSFLMVSGCDDECHRYVHLERPETLLNTLSKFERPQFIEVYWSKEGLEVKFVRFHLSFLLRNDGRLYSLDYKGYYLDVNQLYEDVWYGFSAYLILTHSNGQDVKVLVPVGKLVVDEKGCVSVETPIDYEAHIDVYSYDVHSRFGHFQAAFIESRTYLACVYAACSTLLPEVRHQQCGSELAMRCIRQCWTNRPLTEKEANHLNQLLSFCSLCPALYILCYELQRCSQSWAFLHLQQPSDTSSDHLPPPHPAVVGSYQTHYPDNFRQRLDRLEETMVIGSYYMPKQSLYYNRNPSTALNVNYHNAVNDNVARKLERKLDVSKYCMANSHSGEENKPFPLPMKSQLLVKRGAQWNDEEAHASKKRKRRSSLRSVEKLDEAKSHRGGESKLFPLPMNSQLLAKCGAQRNDEEAHASKKRKRRRSLRSVELDVSEYYEAKSHRGGESKSFPLPMKSQLLENGDVGKRLMADLQESWEIYHSLPVFELSCEDGELKVMLTGHLSAVSTSRQTLEAHILQALNNDKSYQLLPCERAGHQVRHLANLRPLATSYDLLSIVLNPDLCLHFNPFLSEKAIEKVKCMTVTWLQLCTLEDKVQRMLSYVESNQRVKLVQEFQTVRLWDSFEHSDWLVFEVESQLQIRPVQYIIAQALLRNIEGDSIDYGLITQLNMGEGKTRVIIPMLIMSLTRRRHLETSSSAGNRSTCSSDSTRAIVRVHFLNQLLEEAADHLHRYLCAGSLNVKIFTMPFNRDIQLDLMSIRHILAQMEYCRDSRSCICVSIEHRLSLHLKHAELLLMKGYQEECQLLRRILHDVPFLDILDESDEILRCNWQLIYAVGEAAPLPDGPSRWKAIFVLLRILQQQPDALRPWLDDEKVAVNDRSGYVGKRMFPHLRFLSGAQLSKASPDLCRVLAELLFRDVPEEFKWLERYQYRSDSIIRFMTDEEHYDKDLITELQEENVKDLLAFRGLLACGILLHCLQRRHRVDYGLREGGKKRLAVPYRAADTPSERSEYVHPDISLVFTVLSYYFDGLSKEQVKDSVTKLLSLSPRAQETEYKLWLQSGPSHIPSEIDSVKKLDLTNIKQQESVFTHFQYNLATINFWLDRITFPRDMTQYPYRMEANCWHLCNNQYHKPVGFSGTDDNKIILPAQVRQVKAEEDHLLATNGKMLSLLLQDRNSRYLTLPSDIGEGVQEVKGTDCSAADDWKVVLHYAVVEHGCDALIDAGGLICGVSNRQAANHILALLTSQGEGSQRHRKEGVVFFDTAGHGQWRLRDTQNREWALRNAPFTEAQAFVLFDDQHCRGADMKLLPNACAMLTLGTKMPKDKLMQAAGRMRQLSGQQSILLVGKRDVSLQIAEANELAGDSIGEGDLTSKHVIFWALANTVQAVIPHGLNAWARQGTLFCDSLGKKDDEAHVLAEINDLASFYGTEVKERELTESISEHIDKISSNNNNNKHADSGRLFREIKEKVADLASGCRILSISTEEDECERELMQENEVEQEKEVERPPPMDPVEEVDWIYDKAFSSSAVCSKDNILQLCGAKPLAFYVRERLTVHDLQFVAWSPRVHCSRNFMETVQHPASNSATKNQEAVKLDNYLRPVDALLVFPEDHSVLLLSEREADRILSLQWRGGKSTSWWLLSMAYLRLAHTDPLAFQQRFPDLPLTAVQVPVSHLVTLQLFAGETKYDSPDQYEELVRMLSEHDLARKAALELPRMRGLDVMIMRSDLDRAVFDAETCLIKKKQLHCC